jgi:hypothetical protein
MPTAIAIALTILILALTIKGAEFLYYFVLSTPASYLLWRARRKANRAP